MPSSVMRSQSLRVRSSSSFGRARRAVICSHSLRPAASGGSLLVFMRQHGDIALVADVQIQRGGKVADLDVVRAVF